MAELRLDHRRRVGRGRLRLEMASAAAADFGKARIAGRFESFGRHVLEEIGARNERLRAADLIDLLQIETPESVAASFGGERETFIARRREGIIELQFAA